MIISSCKFFHYHKANSPTRLGATKIEQSDVYSTDFQRLIDVDVPTNIVQNCQLGRTTCREAFRISLVDRDYLNSAFQRLTIIRRHVSTNARYVAFAHESSRVILCSYPKGICISTLSIDVLYLRTKDTSAERRTFECYQPKRRIQVNTSFPRACSQKTGQPAVVSG